MKKSKITTVILFAIIFVLVVALGFTIYFTAFKNVNIPSFVSSLFKTNKTSIKDNEIKEEVYVSKLSLKRYFTVDFEGKEYTAKIYPDKTMGIMISKDGAIAKQIENKINLTGNIDKTDITDVDLVYEVKLGTKADIQFLVVKTDGTLWKINTEQLYKDGKIEFIKIEGLFKIARIYQTGVIANNLNYTNANNVIAVDINGLEYIITKLLK